MRTNELTLVAPLRMVVAVIALLGLAAAGAAAEITVHLVADEFTKTVTLPNGATVSVPMWGYGLADEDGALVGALSSPGPRITVPVGDSLKVVLHNQLAVRTSLVIPGQAFTGAPVRDADNRVVSMVAEADSGSSAEYTFSSLKSGTFLYQSGSHQAVQIQMGLYGAVTQDAAPGNAYAGTPYTNEVVLLYSEIDRELHQAVADGTYGPDQPITSTINYYPTLFLINGESYANPAATPAIPGGAATQPTLIRFLNAGLRTHAPVLDGGTLTLVAEDGNKYPYARSQAAIMLAAGKTHDALWTPTTAGIYSVYDRALSLTAEGQGAAGMLAKLSVSGGPAPAEDAPVAVDDVFSTLEDAPTSGSVAANDSGAMSYALVTSTGAGALVFTPAGGFSYTPGPNFFGVDSFSYQAVNGTGSSLATAVITVTPVPDAPVAVGQAVGVQATETLPITLAGNDADGDALTFTLTASPTNGTLNRVDPLTSNLVALGLGPIPGGTVLYTPTVGSGADTFSFVVSDGGLTSGAAAVNVTVHPLAASEAETLSPLALSVVGPNGTPIAGGFRWTLEEDRTYNVQPGVKDPNTLSVSFHASYMPVKRSGDESGLGQSCTESPSALCVDPAKRYFISVLPKEGPYTNGGAPVAAGQGSVTVKVNSGPMPTAQIRVRVFEDNAPLNGAWDTTESGLNGFSVTIEDAGGRYGMSAAQQLMDAFGNPIGTEYLTCSAEDAACDALQVVSYGKGYVLTANDAAGDAGWATLKNLAPGKYGVKVVSPGGTVWQQTATIEGTRTIDAWVKPNEPSYFAEFGPPGPHAEIGFTKALKSAGLTGSYTIAGQVTNLHHSRPPSFEMFSGAPFDFTQPWVALNTGATGGTVMYAQPTDADGNFSIAGVPSGTYQLVIFDSALNIIIATKVLNVTGNLALGAVPVQQWFTRLYHYVFEDTNENGFRDSGEKGLPEQAINLRFRDGSMYQSMPTDGTGFVPFEQVFPFFNWLIAEVDFTRWKATGATVVVDKGGNPTDTGWAEQVGAEVDPAVLMPQPQDDPETVAVESAPFRTETGPVLLEAFQGFIGQSSVMLWGKAPYAPPPGTPGSQVPEVNAYPFDGAFPGVGDVDTNGNGAFDGDQFNGGISGIVHYSITRAENDPRWGGAEVWEPGIADVAVQLWSADRTKLLNEVTTDSWDASQPTGCQGEKYVFLGQEKDCYDGLRNFNQVRPGVFDGGYAFMSQLEPVDPSSSTANWLTPVAARGAGFREVPLPAGKYVVRVVTPPGYKIVKEEDKNVDFGEEYIPQENWLTGILLGDAASAPPKAGPDYEPLAVPFCVGSLHEVQPELALYPGVPGAYAGDQRPLCDQKLVTLRNGQNPGANFFLFTEAPIAGHIVGFVLDDTANEFDPNAPQFGEKYGPPFMPISIRDWTGREVTSTHTDAYGVYNVLVPSTFTANQPIPSGMSPSMLTACINSPTTVTPEGLTVPNPYHYKQYSHFCYTLNFMPGTTTYLDTPVLPTGAFTSNGGQFPVDAELPSGTPVIAKVTNIANLTDGVEDVAAQIGPYIVDRGAGLPGTRTIDMTSGGMLEVPNPAYNGIEGDTSKTILRDYTFGTELNRIVVKLNGTAIPSGNVSWNPTLPGVLRVVVPSGSVTNQLTVERCHSAFPTPCTDVRKSMLGVTLTVATPARHTANPPTVKLASQTIQKAIDDAPVGALVLVPPGTYEEAVVMKKPVRLQGWGALSTVINTVTVPAEKLQAWREYVVNLLNGPGGTDYLLDGQNDILGAPPLSTEGLAAALGGEAPTVMVLGRRNQLPAVACTAQALGTGTEFYCQQNEGTLLSPVLRPNARIDGFSLMGAADGAGVMVNANARFLDIGNNRITNNFGLYAGGIRVGQPGAVQALADEDASNANVTIHNNLVGQNAGNDTAGGGGIVIGTGANNYRVVNNFVAGNFTGGQGAGVSHIGRSSGGLIDGNSIVFNEAFNQGVGRSGGGVFIGGTPAAAGALTPGSGHVRVSNNLIQGNHTASGDGGGIALDGVNGGGPDLGNNNRSKVALYNNIIVNNVAGLAGGGVSLHDAAFVDFLHNTIARNDSFATAGGAFVLGAGDISTPQPAGIVSRAHTPGSGLPGSFSNPTIINSIVFENRSFYFGPKPGGVQNPGDPVPPPVTYGLLVSPAGPGRVSCTLETIAFTCWDLGVLGTTGSLNLQSTTLTGGTTNFGSTYVNASRNPLIAAEAQTSIQVPVAFDEGGTFIRPIFGPLSLQNPETLALRGNYHVTEGVNGQRVPLFGLPVNVDRTPLLFDIDGQARPSAGVPAQALVLPDRGADEYVAPPLSPVSVSDATVTEGDAGTTVMTFTVTVPGTSTNPIDLRYNTTNGTAIGGSSACTPGINTCDYVSIPAGPANAITFAPQETSKTIDVVIKNDTLYEGNQTFNLIVALAPGETDASIFDGTGVGTIVDNDPVPTLTINDPAAVLEPAGTNTNGNTANVNFTITLTGAHEQASSVAWSTADGTAQGGALGGNLGALINNDYRISGTLPVVQTPLLSFAATTAASATSTAAVQIFHNAPPSPADGPAETFLVNLGVMIGGGALAPVNAVITDGQGVGTITNRVP